MQSSEDRPVDTSADRAEGWRGAYREQLQEAAADPRAGGPALGVVAFLVWLAAIARVIGGALTRTPFGADGALAATYLVTGPGLILGELRRRK